MQIEEEAKTINERKEFWWIWAVVTVVTKFLYIFAISQLQIHSIFSQKM